MARTQTRLIFFLAITLLLSANILDVSAAIKKPSYNLIDKPVIQINDCFQNITLKILSEQGNLTSPYKFKDCTLKNDTWNCFCQNKNYTLILQSENTTQRLIYINISYDTYFLTNTQGTFLINDNNNATLELKKLKNKDYCNPKIEYIQNITYIDRPQIEYKEIIKEIQIVSNDTSYIRQLEKDALNMSKAIYLLILIIILGVTVVSIRYYFYIIR